jgi:hypothetical protein
MNELEMAAGIEGEGTVPWRWSGVETSEDLYSWRDLGEIGDAIVNSVCKMTLTCPEVPALSVGVVYQRL